MERSMPEDLAIADAYVQVEYFKEWLPPW